jgi:hypothetical protein
MKYTMEFYYNKVKDYTFLKLTKSVQHRGSLWSVYRDKVKGHMCIRHIESILLQRSFLVVYIFDKCY